MKTLDFNTAFKYAYKNKNAWNFLWMLIPIYGTFLIMGYLTRIITEQAEGKYDGLPGIVHGDDFVLGLLQFLKLIPLAVVLTIAYFILLLIPIIGWLALIVLYVCVLPIIYVHFSVKRTVASTFEFKVVGAVFSNFGEYLLAFLKTIGLVIVFYIGVFLVLIGLPGYMFSSYSFLANFYGMHAAKALKK